MLKQLLVIGVTGLTLACLPGLSVAGDRDRWDRGHGSRYHHSDHYRSRHFRGGHYPQYRRGSGYYRRHWGPTYRYRYGDRYWANAYLGGALFGTALTYSLTHDHHNCSDRSHDHYRGGSRTEIAGCYRIEQLPDGRERRVELPLSACR